MDIRKIIKEEISKIFEQDAQSTLFGDTMSSIEDELSNNLAQVGNIINTQTTDLKDKDSEIKANLQLKSKLNPSNPHRVGLEREIPVTQKLYVDRQKQLKDLQGTQKAMQDAQTKIANQQKELQKQQSQQKVSGGNQKPTSVLPSLQSPI